MAELVDDALRNPDTGFVSPAMAPFADGLKAMKRANSGLTWIRQKHVQDVLKHLAAAETVRHEDIDSLPVSNTTSHLRALLVEYGVLPWRDEYLHLFQSWSTEALLRVERAEHIEIVKRYLRWHQQPRLLNGGTVTRGSFLRAKQDTTVGIQFLNWLHQHGYPLEELNEAHFEEWKVGGTTTRLIAIRFLKWAMKSRLTPVWDEPFPRSPRLAAQLNTHRQDELVEQITHSDKIVVRDRAIGILVLIFAQPIGKIVQLTHDDLKVTKESVSIRLGKINIILPPPLDEPFRELVENPQNHQTAAHPDSKWLFPGGKPGRPINAGYLSNRITSLFPARAARLGSLRALSRLAPAPVIAEALGYNVQTVEAARIESGEEYAIYIEAIRASSS